MIHGTNKLKLNMPLMVQRASLLSSVMVSQRFLNVGVLKHGSPSKRATGSQSATARVTAAKRIRPNQQQNQTEVPAQNAGGEEDNSRWPRRIFSGIQPTGSLHLGNYLGAVRKWTQLQKARDDVTVCIVDMHSITMPHNPPVLRENIFNMAATLLACGIDPSQSTLFVQSSVMEHAEFNWILSSLCTIPRLAQLPQFKEKSRLLKDVPLGLYVYPVLQAADIMLYKATHVPVGADQLQHIQLAQHLARSFNQRYGEIFPVCHAMMEESEASRVLSLRDPTKKMSKSEANPKSTINLSDSPELINEKIKKAVTDFTSDISYNPATRPGVSNLVNIHALVTGQSIKSVVAEASTLDTARYKERVAEAVIEHLRPIREEIQHHLLKRNELIYMLELGAEKARQTAQQTMVDVKQRLGLGTNMTMPNPVEVAPLLPERSKSNAGQRLINATTQSEFYNNQHSTGAIAGSSGDAVSAQLCETTLKPFIRRPVVPIQSLRVEKQRNRQPPRHVFKMESLNEPSIGFRCPPQLPNVTNSKKRPQVPPLPSAMSFSKLPHSNYGKNSFPSAVASITREANAAHRQQELSSTLAHSSYYKAAVNANSVHVPKYSSKAVQLMTSSSASGTSTKSSPSSSSPTSSASSSQSASSLSASEPEESADEQEEDEEVCERNATTEANKLEN